MERSCIPVGRSKSGVVTTGARETGAGSGCLAAEMSIGAGKISAAGCPSGAEGGVFQIDKGSVFDVPKAVTFSKAAACSQLISE